MEQVDASMDPIPNSQPPSRIASPTPSIPAVPPVALTRDEQINQEFHYQGLRNAHLNDQLALIAGSLASMRVQMGVAPIRAPTPTTTPLPNLNLSPLPPFSGLNPAKFTDWSISLSQFIIGNSATYNVRSR